MTNGCERMDRMKGFKIDWNDLPNKKLTPEQIKDLKKRLEDFEKDGMDRLAASLPEFPPLKPGGDVCVREILSDNFTDEEINYIYSKYKGTMLLDQPEDVEKGKEVKVSGREELNKSDTDKGKVVFSILPKDPTDEELQDFINNLTGKDPADNDKK